MLWRKKSQELQQLQEENERLKRKLSFSEEELKNLASTNLGLNEKIKELIKESNAKVENCAIGEWCNECEYLAIVTTIPPYAATLDHYYWLKDGDYNKYCKKRLYDNCPNFKKKENPYY